MEVMVFITSSSANVNRRIIVIAARVTTGSASAFGLAVTSKPVLEAKLKAVRDDGVIGSDDESPEETLAIRIGPPFVLITIVTGEGHSHDSPAMGHDF